MRYFIACALFAFVFSSCKKDNYTTAPQIAYISVNPNYVDGRVTNTPDARVNFEIRDGEGDIGLNAGKDTSFIYMRNLLTNDEDSLRLFPDLTTVTTKNFKAVISASLGKVTKCKPRPGGGYHTDTLYFEIYVRDFKRNKSNVIKTTDPVLFYCN